MRLSDHFTLSELVVTEVRALQKRNRAEAMTALESLRALAALLEQVRALCGNRPVIVHSGYRCPSLNRYIGGAPSSQHMRGEAADLHVQGMDLREAFDKIRASSIAYGQLILEDGDGDGVPTWIHLSLGPPWREASRSQQTMVYDGRTYTKV